ncbi:T9SS type A sorting domain-containing protein [Fluviicola chungangensis]|uniref:T9SS type A sorting domain-containing protein n=1 Tax=Fluviicola chungangensis TaxID=2597671 RepID=A0A556N299_9FLAO|nr:T9SS type A sorting domain-containing protein [Fluviicola chungangensis]TSJ46312.1 T9SS type A sorting domain-containing protein [Fluviicola chungangensis]
MKHLYLLLIVLTNSCLVTAQTISTIHTSGSGQCDGIATFYDSAYFSGCTWNWYEDDTITIIATGGQTVSNLCAGDYFLVLDSTGFTQIVSFTVNDSCPNITFSTSLTDCTPGNCDAVVQTFAFGGTAPYLFTIGGGSQTSASTFSNLCAGTYLVTCTDAMNCTASFTATVSDTSLSTISPNLTIVNDMNMSCVGSAQVAPTGSGGPYNYLWSTGETTGFVNMLCVGNYWVTVYTGTDTVTVNFTITDDCTGFTGITSYTPTSGPGICDGTVTFTPYGGVAPYTYNWNSGATTQSISNICIGNYTVYCTDAMGCVTNNLFVTVTYTPPPFSINLTTEGDLTGNCMGNASAAPTGSPGPYSYLWSTGETTSVIGNLCVGNYSVMVWDSADTVTANFTITNPCVNFTASFSETGTINGNCIGSSTITATGGAAPYEYSWDGGTSFNAASIILNLCPGNYDIVCRDQNGCEITEIITITDSINILSANLTSADDLTNNCSGSASVTPSGGVAPYTIAWSTGETTNSISTLCAGIYSVSVWDSGSDSATVNFVIADSSSTYNNNPYPNGAINDTLYTDLVTNCVIDYNTIDSASLYQAVYNPSNQSLYVTWAVYSPTDTVYISDTLALIGNPGYYTLTITVYCPNKSGNDFFKIEQVVYFDGMAIHFSTLGVDEHALDIISVYPNPFGNAISVDNKDGAIRSLKLVDLNGRVLSEMSSVNSGMVKLDQLETISSGTYLLILSGENSSKTYKVIK